MNFLTLITESKSFWPLTFFGWTFLHFFQRILTQDWSFRFMIPISNLSKKKFCSYILLTLNPFVLESYFTSISGLGGQWWAKLRLSTFDLYPWREGHGVQGQICDILRSQLGMNRFLPYWTHWFPHFGYIYLGGGGALILGRCRAFDLFASVDAHLCWRLYLFEKVKIVVPYILYQVESSNVPKVGKSV